MNSRNGFEELALPGEGDRTAPILSDTYWGYVMRPAETFLRRAAMVEIVASFAGVLVLFVAGGHWFLSGAEVLWIRITATLVFLVLGAVLVWTGKIGLVQEMHVDTTKSELRLVQRNRNGDGRLNMQIRFCDVASVLILPPQLSQAPARLCLRLQNGDRIDLLGAPEQTLLPVRDRLIGDLAPRFRTNAEPAGRRVRLLTKAAGPLVK